MHNSNKNSSELKSYLKILSIFFIFTAVSLMAFFRAIRFRVDDKIITKITTTVQQQSTHFYSTLSLQYQYMEGMASYIGRQNDLISDTNMALIKCLSDAKVFERTAIIEADGSSHYDNGEVKNVKDRNYFQTSMKGDRCLSDPLVSMIDHETRVILSVPIYSPDHVVNGILAGSYNIGSLNRILFEDAYGGSGYSMIVNQDGVIVSSDGDADLYKLQEDDNFINYYASMLVSRKNSVQNILQDFADQQQGAAKIQTPDGIQYLSYAPLYLNGWMLCYVVNQDVAVEPYSFIEHYELRLIEALSIAFLIFAIMAFRTARRRQKTLLFRAQVDELTGIYNKHHTEVLINQWLDDDNCSGLQAFLMMDVDEFKGINDTHGHLAGDKVLQEVGLTLRRHFREGDIIGRIGGDEFVVLMKNIPSREIAEAKAITLCNTIRDLTINGMADIHFTTSIGLSFSPDHGSSYTELYQCADIALYTTKQRGRDGYSTYKKSRTV
jgi:diguanylate cyclase (GGDEF)-like protein